MTGPIKCPYCGAEIHEGASFCLYCMHTLTEKKDIPAMVPRRHRRFWIALLSVMCILLFALTCYLCYRKDPADISVSSDTDEAGNISIHSYSITATDRGSTVPNSELISESVSESTDSTTESISAETPVFGDESTGEIISGNESPVEIDPDQEPTVATEPVNTPTVDVEPTGKTEDNPDVPDNPTKPELTPPVVTEPSVACMHSYSKATCISPQTCTLCGATKGDILPDGHNWVGHTRTIRHEEVGHWEEVVTHSVLEIRYLCFYCSYSQEGYASLDALRDHMTVHSHKSDYQYILSKLESVSDTREVWVPVYETQWIVDEKAYTETITEYTCSYCGKDK